MLKKKAKFWNLKKNSLKNQSFVQTLEGSRKLQANSSQRTPRFNLAARVLEIGDLHDGVIWLQLP